ncbi:hypothetical protein [Winogradskya humida]|uniref:Excreted virulence factor EspC (Type VII ESX diderm) n=1 Tax=Winogradskya humida TaxID=113566 RepID=A0ABQ3ZYA4_9ACTN|nr:hypothetical protein [Actinoplanes humidus]GIE23469.1 hypothetical protein Ahu01nite_065710 [Actinoplanes humidus]
MPSTEIDVPELIKIGEGIGGVAERLHRTAADVEGWSSQGGNAVEGSYLCAGTMYSTAAAWSRELDQLAGTVKKLGADLTTTATDYQSYDDLTAQQLRQISDPTFGPAY